MIFKKCNLYLFKNCTFNSVDDIELYLSNIFRLNNNTKYKYFYDTNFIYSLNKKNILISSPILYRALIKNIKCECLIKLNINNYKNYQIFDNEIDTYDDMIQSCVYGYLKDYQIMSLNLSDYDRSHKYYMMSILQTQQNNNKKKFNKKYHFFLSDCTIAANFYDLKHLYRESFFVKSDHHSKNLIITTDNNQFLKKCISRFKPNNIKLLDRERYKEIESLYDMKTIFII